MSSVWVILYQSHQDDYRRGSDSCEVMGVYSTEETACEKAFHLQCSSSLTLVEEEHFHFFKNYVDKYSLFYETIKNYISSNVGEFTSDPSYDLYRVIKKEIK